MQSRATIDTARTHRRASLPDALKWLTLRAAAPLLEPFYGGIGSIPMFHRIVDDANRARFGWVPSIEAAPEALEGTVKLFRRHRYTFVSLDELHAALGATRSRRAPKLAAMTFDDGYIDTFTVAYPLLGSMGVPFTVYVATAFPDKTMTPWWYLLDDVLRSATELRFERGKVYSWRLSGEASREQAFREADAVFAALPPADARALANALFGEARVAEATRALAITWEMLETMARSGRVTIGAHTVDHVNLPALPHHEAHAQMAASKARIEERAAVSVAHFAYPFGAFGPRECEIAREVGFRTAVSARIANVFAEHAKTPHALPRLYAATEEKRELQLRGAWPALMNRGRRVVTVD